MTSYTEVLTDSFGADDSIGNFGLGAYLSSGMALHTPLLAYAFQPGAIVDDGLGLHAAAQLQGVYSQPLAETMKWSGSLSKGQAVALSSGIGLHLTQALARAITVTGRLGLHPALTTNSVSQLGLSTSLLVHDAILEFWGLVKIDDLRLHDAFAATFQFGGTLAADMGFASVLLDGGLFSRILDDDITIDDSQLLNMIYRGDTLSDDIQFSIGFIDAGGNPVIDPITGLVTSNGGFTAFAINTRTNAVTEYSSNFQFNSFARIGNEYYGANNNGLWLLNSETDAGANIVADIKSGLLEFGDSRYTQFDGIYLGLRTSDNARDWFLKIQTPGTQVNPAGATYTYQFIS